MCFSFDKFACVTQMHLLERDQDMSYALEADRVCRGIKTRLDCLSHISKDFLPRSASFHKLLPPHLCMCGELHSNEWQLKLG